MGSVSTESPKSLPRLPHEVTAEWLSEVMGCRVATAEITSTIHGTASKLLVTVTYDADDETAREKPTRFCVKGGFDPNIIKAYPFVTKTYRREADFYAKLTPRLTNLDLPQILWAGQDGEQGIVVMEDLAAVRGCTFGEPIDTWEPVRMRSGLEQLAALHAATWGQTSEHHPWMINDYDDVILAMLQTYGEVVNGPDRPEGVFDYLKDQDRMIAAHQKHYRTRNPKFHCLVHGDAHTGNTFAAPGGGPCFIDWQVLHFGSCFQDVAYFMASILSIDDRRMHERALLSHYLDALAGYGGPRFTVDEEDVMVEYRKSMLAGVGWIMVPYIMQPKERAVPMAQRFSAALDDHKVMDLIESLPDVEKAT